MVVFLSLCSLKWVFCQQQRQVNDSCFWISLPPKSHPQQLPRGREGAGSVCLMAGKLLVTGQLTAAKQSWKMLSPHCLSFSAALLSSPFSLHSAVFMKIETVLIFACFSYKNSWSWIMESKFVKDKRTVRQRAGTEKISAKMLLNVFDKTASNSK